MTLLTGLLESLCQVDDCVAPVQEIVDGVFWTVCPNSGPTPECIGELRQVITNVINSTCTDDSYGEQGAIECVNMAVELITYYESVVRDKVCYEASWTICARRIADEQVAFIMGVVDSVCNDPNSSTSGAAE